MSKIAIVGYGNLGYHLDKHLSKKNEVVVFSRNPSSDDIRPLMYLEDLDFDFIILSVPDDAIQPVAASFRSRNAIVLHTSGSRPLTDLSSHQRHGVLYPLQTFSASQPINFDSVQFLIEGSEDAEMQIFGLARSIGNEVRLVSSSNRMKIHAAAVFACNFTNHMFHIAERLMEDLDMKFQDLQPLVEETVKKALEQNPSNAQTGPAVRSDTSTMAAHSALLTEQHWKAIYELVSKDIQKLREGSN